MHRRGLLRDKREAVGYGLVWAIRVSTYIATLPLLQQKKGHSSIMRRGDGHLLLRNCGVAECVNVRVVEEAEEGGGEGHVAIVIFMQFRRTRMPASPPSLPP
jgi:hypothetical protein